MPASSKQNEWVLRVLGVALAGGRAATAAEPPVPSNTLASLSEKAAKLGVVGRPGGPPKSVATSRLLGALGNSKAPDDPRAVPGHVEGFVPGFLATVESERPVTSKPLAPGEKLGGLDQVLGLADLFAAVQRSLIVWEQLLAEAEQSNAQIDKLEAAEDRDDDGYADALASYNALRTSSQAAEQRSMPLVEALQAKFNSLSADQQQAAAKEAPHA